MGLETNVTNISHLDPDNPLSTDLISQSDDHLRLIKRAVKTTFAQVTGAVTASHTELNHLTGFTGGVADLNYAKDLRATDVTAAEFDTLDGITASTVELNILDGVTASTAELNILDGVTSSTEELNKLDGFTGDVADLNYAKDLRATGVTSTEFDYLDGVSSGIQNQINGKVSTGRTVSAGGGLTGGGALSGDITITHADTSTQESSNNSGRTYIQDITLDGYGHVTGINVASETVVNTNTTYTAGNGIGISGTTFSVAAGGGLSQSSTGLAHNDTSTQASVNNSGNTVIQDVLLDGYGHVTTLRSKALSIPTGNTLNTSSRAWTDGSGGLQIRYGSFSSSTDGDQTVNFTSAFSNACFVCIVGGEVLTKSVSRTQFIVNREDSYSGTISFQYLAIGR